MSRLTDAEIRLAAHGGEQFDYTALPPVETWDIDKNSAFVHFAINETVNGLQYQTVPKLSDDLPPLVCDMSSEILSREFDVSDYGLIYAGAQKNIGPAGATVVIIREDLLDLCPDSIFLLSASFVGGALLLLLVDTTARLLLMPHLLPVSVLTAFLGAPAFLWLIIRRQRT